MRRFIPVLVLLVLSPFIAEVLFGATPVSNIGSLIITGPFYGAGVLLIRDLARRRGSGWGRIVLLGTAHGIVEEGLVIQSLFNPTLFNAGIVGGRAFGVNWVWTQWALGYHIVWSIVIPILLAELLFPKRQAEPWLGKLGLMIATVVYTISGLAMGAVFRLFVTPDFHTPLLFNTVAAIFAAALVVLALCWPHSDKETATIRVDAHPAPSPWLVGLTTLVSGVAWFSLLDLPYALRSSTLVLLPMLGTAAIVAVAAGLIQRWSAKCGWCVLHQLALIGGALVPSLGYGFIFVTAPNRSDHIAQGLLSVTMILALAMYAWRQHHYFVNKFS